MVKPEEPAPVAPDRNCALLLCPATTTIDRSAIKAISH
jgi:hypothetical protein